METVVISTNRKQLWFSALGGLGFVIAALFILVEARPPSDFIMRVVGVLGVLFFGACSVIGFVRLLSPRPALLLTADGIHETSMICNLGTVAWEDITGFSYWETHHQRALCLYLRDPEKYIARLSPALQKLARANIGLAGTPLTIMQSNISIPLEALKDSIEVRIARRNGHSWAVDPLQNFNH